MLKIFLQETVSGGGPYYSQYLAYAALVMLLCLFLILARRMLSAGWRNAVVAFTVVCCLRLVLFFNPFIWLFYFKTLSVKDVGWQRKYMLALEYSKYHRSFFQPQPYVVLGTSQVEKVENIHGK
jgi:apolipoprotein N-acyltransferase